MNRVAIRITRSHLTGSVLLTACSRRVGKALCRVPSWHGGALLSTGCLALILFDISHCGARTPEPNEPAPSGGKWEKEFQLSGHTGNIQSLAFSRDGKFVASGDSAARVRLWETAGGKELFVAVGPRPRGNIRCLAFSPDGKALASGNLGSIVRLLDVPTGKELAVLQGPKFAVVSAVFSSDGKYLAAAGSSGELG